MSIDSFTEKRIKTLSTYYKRNLNFISRLPAYYSTEICVNRYDFVLDNLNLTLLELYELTGKLE